MPLLAGRSGESAPCARRPIRHSSAAIFASYSYWGWKAIRLRVQRCASQGSHAWHKMRHVTLPLATGITLCTLILSVMGAHSDAPAVLRDDRRGPERPAYCVCSTSTARTFEQSQIGYASCSGWILIMVSLSVLLFRISSHWIYHADR